MGPRVGRGLAKHSPTSTLNGRRAAEFVHAIDPKPELHLFTQMLADLWSTHDHDTMSGSVNEREPVGPSTNQTE